MNHIEQSIHQVNFPFLDSGSNFCDYLHQIWQLAKDHPQILQWLEQDQDRHGLNKKRLRKKCQQWARRPQQNFSFLSGTEETEPVGSLATGRPRMKPIVLWTFMQVCGYYGSLREQKVWDFCCESRTLRQWLQNQGLSMPGRQTIIDNLNVVEEKTMQKIHGVQMRWLRRRPLEDEPQKAWQTILVDSTAVISASRFGTDSSLAAGCLERIILHWEKVFKRLEYKKPLSCKMPKWHGQMKQLDWQINRLKKRKGAKGQRRKLYRKLIIKGINALHWCHEHLPELWTQCAGLQEGSRWLLKKQISSLIEAIESDLKTLTAVLSQAHERVLAGKKVAACHKVLSLSDADAAMIVKGGRDVVLGYKVQLSRTAHGYISAMDVQSGNPTDSSKLALMIKSSNRQTGVKARQVSVDDGYSSAQGVRDLIQLKVHTVSISGSKGKELLGPEHWEKEEIKQLRQLRPAIESSIFTIKYRHGFDRMGGFGLDRVKHEMWLKIQSFNMVHYLIKKRQQQKVPIFGKAA